MAAGPVHHRRDAEAPGGGGGGGGIHVAMLFARRKDIHRAKTGRLARCCKRPFANGNPK